jgi:hypothetical protein
MMLGYLNWQDAGPHRVDIGQPRSQFWGLIALEI